MISTGRLLYSSREKKPLMLLLLGRGGVSSSRNKSFRSCNIEEELLICGLEKKKREEGHKTISHLGGRRKEDWTVPYS